MFLCYVVVQKLGWFSLALSGKNITPTLLLYLCMVWTKPNEIFHQNV